MTTPLSADSVPCGTGIDTGEVLLESAPTRKSAWLWRQSVTMSDVYRKGLAICCRQEAHLRGRGLDDRVGQELRYRTRLAKTTDNL